MNEQKINDLKDALREIVKMISSREGPLPEDLKVLLVQVMEHVANRIQELRSEETQEPVENLPPGQPPNQLEPAPYPSSNINGFKYNYKTGKLLVKFMGKDTADSGPTYSYEGVPKFIYDTFARGAVPPHTSGKNKWHQWEKGVMPSLGAAMYHLIRTNYPYQKLS